MIDFLEPYKQKARLLLAKGNGTSFKNRERGKQTIQNITPVASIFPVMLVFLNI
jgi:hypothetical protein